MRLCYITRYNTLEVLLLMLHNMLVPCLRYDEVGFHNAHVEFDVDTDWRWLWQKHDNLPNGLPLPGAGL
jgi:hypothetical protein